MFPVLSSLSPFSCVVRVLFEQKKLYIFCLHDANNNNSRSAWQGNIISEKLNSRRLFLLFYLKKNIFFYYFVAPQQILLETDHKPMYKTCFITDKTLSSNICCSCSCASSLQCSLQLYFIYSVFVCVCVSYNKKTTTMYKIKQLYRIYLFILPGNCCCCVNSKKILLQICLIRAFYVTPTLANTSTSFFCLLRERGYICC